MSINSISSSSQANAALVRNQAESKEVSKAGRDTRMDKDSDDIATPASAATKPTVNSNGQMIGTIISTSA